MLKPLLILAIMICSVLQGCAAGGAAKPQYPTVKVSYSYGAHDKSERAWRALLRALDECHNDGYRDAYPAAAPVIACDQSAGGNCTRFQASASYDCVGMGYQPF